MFQKKNCIYLICFFFFVAYSLLSVIRHNHFLSGYDLTVSDQGIWLMSKFKEPISTPHAYAFTSLFADHVEVIYALLSPIYWFTNDIRVILVLQALAVSVSAIPIYLLARLKKLHFSLQIVLVISFLLFYGIQNALWADMHSLVFAAAFLPWFIYFLEKGRVKLTFLFFLLAISCKEDIAMFTFLISFVFFVAKKQKIALVLMALSLAYLGFLFGIYYPHFTPNGYRFQNEGGLLSHLNFTNMYSTPDKRDVLLYSALWFGFLPLLLPLYLLLPFADLAHYFVLGSNYVTSAQGLFLHYRVTLATFLVWPTILVIARYKKLNNRYVAGYLLVIALLLQYTMHLPLSYLAKKWFWQEPQSISTINSMLTKIPADAAVVTQVNIAAHLNHRQYLLTLWPDKKHFKANSPCGKPECNWFRWAGEPKLMIVDTSADWDARYWLTNREEFVDGLKNLEKAKVIVKERQEGETTIYKIIH